MAITLTKIFAGISDYVSKHESNYTAIETAINDLLLTAGSAGASLSVPTGLREIFDRNGVIGIGSYRLIDQTVVGDSLTIPAGAAWIDLSFRTKADATILNTSSLTTGTRYIDIDSAGIPSLSNSQTTNSIYSFSWDSGTAVISNTTLLVDILFDGDDYQDILDSNALSLSFTSAADRFENLESQLGPLGGYYAQDTITTSGLTFGFQAGVVRNDNVVVDTAAGTITLVDNATNYVEVNPNTGVVSTNTTGFTTLLVPLFVVTTVSGAITDVDDRRTWAALAGAGGGGHSQNTDVGTSSDVFTLNRLEAGTPSLNATFAVERGTSPNVGIRWNEATDTWEQTTDGTVWTPLGAPDLGQQEITKTTMFEDPPAVVSISGMSSDVNYVQVDLTSDPNFSGILSGLQGMLLRVQLDDSSPDANTQILIRKIENFQAAPTESMRVYARDTSLYKHDEGTVLVTPGEGRTMANELKIGFEYKVTASGPGTANLKIFVLGYWEKVTGVGTQDIVFQSAGNSAAVSTTTQFNTVGFANRALAHKITINETSGNPSAFYHVKLYKHDTFLEADLLYHVQNIVPGTPFVDYLPVWLSDGDLTAELHMAVTNDDGGNEAVVSITIESERFA